MLIKSLDLKNNYSNICSLWDEYSIPNVSLELLSPFGVVAEIDNKIVGAIFMYISYGVPTCLLRFPVISKSIENKDEVFNGMLDLVHSNLKQLGYKYVLCSTNHNGLIRKLKNKNYEKSFSNCSHLEGVL